MTGTSTATVPGENAGMASDSGSPTVLPPGSHASGLDGPTGSTAPSGTAVISGDGSEFWPSVQSPTSAWREAIEGLLRQYRDAGFDPAPWFVDYGARSSYLHFETEYDAAPTDSVVFDGDGIPQTVVHGERYYAPVAVAQYALSLYGKYLNDPTASGPRDAFLTAVSRLQQLQGADGALRYPFAWKYYLSGETYQPGWVSSMAQGQAMSAFVRAFEVTGDPTYLDSARRAYQFLQVPVAAGGVRSDLGDLDASLTNYPFYEEYVSTPDGYTLNGFMFTLLGISDYCQTAEEQHLPETSGCQQTFAEGINTLTHLLPYYDLGTFSSYDLGHYTWGRPVPHMSAKYHMIHIFLLHALYTLTDNPELERYAQKWASYVE